MAKVDINLIPDLLALATTVLTNKSEEQTTPNVWKHNKENLFGKSFSVVYIKEKKYLIGVQVAKLLNRETFNLYRSMKVKAIEVIRADPTQLEWLMKVSAVKRGTRSATLIGYTGGVEFVDAELKKQTTKPKTPSSPVSSDNEDISDSNNEEIAAWEILLSLNTPRVNIPKSDIQPVSRNTPRSDWMKLILCE